MPWQVNDCSFLSIHVYLHKNKYQTIKNMLMLLETAEFNISKCSVHGGLFSSTLKCLNYNLQRHCSKVERVKAFLLRAGPSQLVTKLIIGHRGVEITMQNIFLDCYILSGTWITTDCLKCYAAINQIYSFRQLLIKFSFRLYCV